MTYKQYLKTKQLQLTNQDQEDIALKQIFLHYLNIDTASYILKCNEEISQLEIDKVEEKLNQYIFEGMPCQYIIGHTYFYNNYIEVTPDVLIPRFETEQLVDIIINLAKNKFKNKPIKILDLCTGSGCIAVALKKQLVTAQVFASDISKKAISVAKKNALINNVEIEFVESDLLNYFVTNNILFDVIVTNPPYVPTSSTVQKIVLENEPHLALYSGETGFIHINQILDDLQYVVNDQFIFGLEHDITHFAKIEDKLKCLNNNYKLIKIKDYSNKDRFCVIQEE